MTKELFITQLFSCSGADEAFNYFTSNSEFPTGSITIIDCINVLYLDEFRTKTWQQMDEFIPSSMHLHKLIMRDLIDIGYITVCPDIIDCKTVYDVTFFLVEKGMLCIASEFFVTAMNVADGIPEEWERLGSSSEPNLRKYIEKFADKDVNLSFIQGFFS